MVDVVVVAAGVVVALVGGGFGALMARRRWSLRRAIAGADGVDAGALAPGVVELDGDARPAAETFTSPLTGQECVVYQYEVEERRRKSSASDQSTGSRTTWETIVDLERAAPFYVDDGSGRALVDAPVADFELERAYAVDSEDATASTAGKVLATITGRDADPDLPITDERREEMREADRKRRYRERLVLPDESVYVYGEAMSPADVDRGTGGASSLAGLLASSDGLAGTVLGGVVSTVGDTGGYRRAKRRGHERTDFDDLGPTDPRTVAEAGPIGSALEDVGEAVAGDDDPFAGEDMVVSRGDTIDEFVLSDREKGDVLRSYSTSTLKWAGLAVVSVAAGVAVAAYGLGVVPGVAGP